MFEQAVFAGGGHRCWWQAGFWETVREPLALRPRVIAGASAGAATARLLYANNAKDALAYYAPIMAAQKSNTQWSHLFTRGKRVLPHESIYRAALTQLLGGFHFKELLWAAPEIRVVCAQTPSLLPMPLAATVGLATYQLEKHLFQRIHPRWGRAIGFKPVIKRVQDCANQEELIDLLLATSATPPFTGAQALDGVGVLDGGMVDNVPVHAVDPQVSTLVLLSRHYARHAPMFSRDGCVYVQPSKKVAATQWDYTDHAALVSTYELGCSDGAAFLRGFEREVGVNNVNRSISPQ
jgi:predicted acylesterase/phospholipase RssA